MAEDAAYLLARLRRNDPSETRVSIYLREIPDDALSKALQANDHLTA
jgi:hypothetical protein